MQPTVPVFKLKGLFKASKIDSYQLQKLDFFENQSKLAQFRKQRDEFDRIFRQWTNQHHQPEWKFELELGTKIRNLVHQTASTGNMTAFARYFVNRLVESFYDQSTIANPSPDCSMETSQVDFFDLRAQNIDLSALLKTSDTKKIALLEQRMNGTSNQSSSQLRPPIREQASLEFGDYPGSQSFYHDFLRVGNASNIHLNILDILFESISILIGQLSELDELEETKDGNFRQMLMESRVLSLLSKFAGLLYFYPYSNASTSVLLECEPHRKCPIDLTKVLLGESNQLGENTQKSFFHFIINLAWITEFIRQSKFKSVINGTFDQSSAHIQEFEKLGSIAHSLLQNLGTVYRKYLLNYGLILERCEVLRFSRGLWFWKEYVASPAY